MRGYFSSYFLWSAQHLSGLAGAIEDRHEGEPRFDIEHRSYVLSSIQTAMAFLEAMINELYQDAHDGHGVDGDGYLAPLLHRTRELMRELWRSTDEGVRLRLLDKYQLLLRFADREPLNPDENPHQNTSLLIRLRNILVHYRPDDLSADVPHAIERWLRGKFPDNALMAGSGNPWWPDHCLGHGCSAWSYRTAKALADRVTNELGIRPNYQQHDDAGLFGGTPGSSQ